MTNALNELPKQYDHARAEERWYPFWKERGYFHSEADPERKQYPKGPFTIVIPPPNVTGALHLGHALNNTLQDILIRWKRMQGFNALWMPGTDHAGIATQAVVERRLFEEEKQTRHDLGREKLVERIWAWKNDYEARILSQLEQMGCSCDWQRTRFTLDPICARAVRHTFFRMFQDGLIYRGQRLVNWDTFLQTAVSDDEVFHETVQGSFWHFRYPVVDPRPGEPTHVTVATTRPETMLGDTAVAVHPDPARALEQVERELEQKLAAASEKEQPALSAQLDDVRERRRSLLPKLIRLRDMAQSGRKVLLPLLNREIPLVADEWARPELGSGCVKITPAHDPNDYEVGLRQKLPMINILNPEGTLNAATGPYQRLKVLKARERVVADLESLGLVEKIEEREIELAHSDRSKTPIEPYLADQWFVKMKDLAQSAMDAVTDNRVKIVPSRYAKGYLDWLGEKRDWPVSRQLWWGHQIPVWNVTLNQAFFEKWREKGGRGVSAESNDRSVTRYEIDGVFASDGIEDFREQVAEDPTAPIGTLRFCTLTPEADGVFERIAKEIEYRKAGKTLLSKYELAATYADSVSRDPDVLDTWFSSALWPHSTLGWPDQTPELAYYYPTSTLITSRDIITLWVARMVLTGLYNVGDVPFREVFIHPKILDGFGEGMSKSKGNGVDPLDVIEKFGADALRFGLAYITTETQDVRMPVDFECPHCGALIEQTKKNRVLPRVECNKCRQPFSTQWASKPADLELARGAVVGERFELGRNFCNKLWNASRFALMNLEDYVAGPVSEDELALEDRWILSRLATVTANVTDALGGYRYADAARALYDFAWDEFCSFYLEMVKSRLQDPASRPAAQRVFAHTLDNLLRLLHPMVPFITEEVWQLLGQAAGERGLEDVQPAAESVMIAAWPVVDAARQNPQIEARFARFQQVLSGLREIRSRQNISPKTPIRFAVRAGDEAIALLRPMETYFESMAGAQAVEWGAGVTPPDRNESFSVNGAEVFVDLTDFVDAAAELARNAQEIIKLQGLIAAKEKQLSNENFTRRAPAEIVQKERDALERMKSELTAKQAYRRTLEKLKAS